jgi:hypothetical protein
MPVIPSPFIASLRGLEPATRHHRHRTDTESLTRLAMEEAIGLIESQPKAA